jgi:hypothetical protein
MTLKQTKGIVSFIGPIKAFGKMRSVGIKIEGEGDDVWHNIAEFSEEQVRKILGGIKAGDEVLLIEEPRQEGKYINVIKIDILNSLKVSDSGTESANQTTLPETAKSNAEIHNIALAKSVNLVRSALEETRKLISEEDLQRGFNPNNVLEAIITLYMGFE